MGLAMLVRPEDPRVSCWISRAAIRDRYYERAPKSLAALDALRPARRIFHPPQLRRSTSAAVRPLRRRTGWIRRECRSVCRSSARTSPKTFWRAPLSRSNVSSALDKSASPNYSDRTMAAFRLPTTRVRSFFDFLATEGVVKWIYTVFETDSATNACF
jgi:hypothetical protein